MTATLQLRVDEACELNPLIRMFVLRADDGRALPGYSAGAHIRVQVELPDGTKDWRN
jgi:ferredoxin-NADP reductase